MAKIFKNTLKPIIERWDDPGDYPSGAGSGPLPSYDYVEGYEGQVEVQLTPREVKQVEDYADDGLDWMKMVQAWLDESPETVEVDAGGLLKVIKWSVDKAVGAYITLSIEECQAEVPETPEQEYEPELEMERKERRKANVD